MSTITRATYQAAPAMLTIEASDGSLIELPLTREGFRALAALLDELGIDRPAELVVDEDSGELLEPELIGLELPGSAQLGTQVGTDLGQIGPAGSPDRAQRA